MDVVDKIIIEYAASFMMAFRKGRRESVTIKDVQEFVALLSADGLKELYQIANKLDFLDGAVARPHASYTSVGNVPLRNSPWQFRKLMLPSVLRVSGGFRTQFRTALIAASVSFMSSGPANKRSLSISKAGGCENARPCIGRPAPRSIGKPPVLRLLGHVGRNPPRLIAPRQCRPSHWSLPSDKSIAAPNCWFGLQSIAVLRIGSTPVTEFLFAFGQKPDATRTSDATQTVGNSSASHITTCAPRGLFP
jgi:hypothetical protein